MNNVEQLFKFPKDEIRRIEGDFRKTFGNTMSQFIEQEARIIASNYHDQCAHILVDRFIEINKVVKELPAEPTKKQYDKFVQDILSLAEPSEIANEIEIVITNTDVYQYYQDFINRSDGDLFHQVYIKCAFSKEATILLNQLAMSQMKASIDQLHQYINSLREHNQLIKRIQEKRQGDSILKTGASIIGLGLGIPFLGMGLGALLGGGDKQKIQESLGNIFDHIDFLEESLYDTVDKLGDSLYLLFLTLVGGTFIAVNGALHTQNIRIEKMDDNNTIIYALTHEEKEKFEKWFHVSITGITELVKEKRLLEAIRIVKEMHQMIADKPLHSFHEIVPNKSALYIAHVYYYAVYQEALLVEYRAGHIDSFLTQSKAFWDTMILYPLEKDFPAFASHPAQFIFLYVKQYMRHHPNELYWLNKADEYISIRHENIVLKGEHGENPKDYAQNITIYFLVSEFYRQTNKIKTNRSDRKYTEQFYRQLTDEKLAQLIAIDSALNQPDALTEFLHTIYERRKKAKRAPFIRWSLRLAVATVFLALLIVVSKPIIQKIGDTTEVVSYKFSESTSFLGEQWVSLKSSVTGIWSSVFGNDVGITSSVSAQQVMIIEPTVNLRETPSLEGNIIATGYANETYSYLSEEQVDTVGVTWLTIQLTDGRIAYVSKKVTVIR